MTRAAFWLGWSGACATTALLWFALVLVSCVHVPRIAPAARLTGQQYDLTVALEAVCTGRDWIETGKLASGVLVDGRHALTAAHILACPFPPVIRMTMANGKSYRMAIEWESPAKDLARLVIASADVLPIVPPIVGEPVVNDTICVAVAMPSRQLNCGVIEAVGDSTKGDIRSSALAERGNSGAGMYNARGELVGISSSMSLDQTSGFATRVAGNGVMP